MEDCRFLEPLNERQTVFLVRSTETGRILTARQLTASQTQPYRLLATHPVAHVPRVRGIREDGPEEFLVYSDYIPGITLEQRLTRGPLDEGTAAALAMQLCDTLEQLNALNIVHRDIKPGNIIVTEEGEPWLIDFDISRLEKPGRGQDTQMLGTVGYASPEQFGFRQTDCRADLYAMGVLLNVMVTGGFPNESPAPGPLGGVIARCIQLDPAARYASPGELRHALAALHPAPRPGLRPPPLPSPAALLRRLPGAAGGDYVKAGFSLLFVVMALLVMVLELPLALHSPADFAMGVFLWLTMGGWVVFVLDGYGVRSRFGFLQRRRGQPGYTRRAMLVMLCWMMALLLVTTAVVGLLGLPPV